MEKENHKIYANQELDELFRTLRRSEHAQCLCKQRKLLKLNTVKLSTNSDLKRYLTCY